MNKENTTKFDKVKYDNDYRKQHYRRLCVSIPFTDTEAIEKIESVESINGYILDLIHKDIEKSKK